MGKFDELGEPRVRVGLVAKLEGAFNARTLSSSSRTTGGSFAFRLT